MDELKRRTLTRWQSGHTGHKRRSRVRARVLTLLLITGFALTGGGAAVLAAKGGNPGAKKNENAGNSQYRPGKGCGDKNRPHTGPPGNLSNKDCPPQAK